MVTSPTGKGVIIMGGIYSGRPSKAMFEMTQSMEWTILEQTLQIEHWAPLAIPIPDELVKIVKPKKKSTRNDKRIKEWVKKKTVAKNMRKVDLVIYLESIGVKVTTAMKAKKDNLVQEVYNHFA